MPEATGWALVLHGGAKEIVPVKEEPNRAGCRAAAKAGAAVLAGGGSAVEAVEAAIRVLEEDPTFNAGFGADLNADGAVELDAGIMDGGSFDVGAVAGVAGVRHPISVARALLAEPPVLLVAEGARRFAASRSAELCAPEALISEEQAQGFAGANHDTVGCVARDAHGRIAAGTSTGGLTGTLPGRVGDSPMPGCGFYADDAVGGVSLSGTGEDIARMMLAARIMRGLEDQEPTDAVRASLRQLERIDGEAGAIAIDAAGRIGWAHNSPHFAVAMVTAGMTEPRVFLRKDEEEESHD